MTNARRVLALAACLAAAAAVAKPPKLTVFIAVDSMGSDVFLRNKPRYKAGFDKVIREGAFFPVAKYDYAETVTAAGHTTLSTGANPWRHGVISNKVLNRATGKLEPIFTDPNHPVLEAPIGIEDSSPVALKSETLSDRVTLSTQGKGKAVAIAGKARAAIAMGGKLGRAFWFSEATGKFVTGTYYLKELPTWVKQFDDKKPAEAWFGKEWALLDQPKSYEGEDERVGESDWYGLGKKFPHPLSGGLPQPGPQSYSALASSAMFNELEVAFAKAAIDGEGLGKDDVPDLLSVSFSSVDRTFHLWGPYSWEMQDQLARLDRAIADLIAAAEKAAGRGNVLVVISADHGGANIPEQWAAAGLDGVRQSPVELEKGLDKELGQGKGGGGHFVSAIEETDVYLDLKAIADKKLDVLAVRRQAAAWLSKQPNVELAVSRDDLGGPDPSPGYLSALRAGYFADRSGDVLFVTRPFAVLEVEPAGTSHGTPYSYDNEVPAIFWGKNVRPGLYAGPIRTVDVASTAAALMEIGEPAQSEGAAREAAISGR